MLASIFRDSAAYVDRYFAQVDALRQHIPVTLYLAEGDSTDGTWVVLNERTTDDDYLFQIAHGGPKIGSVNNPQRWKQIAYVCNGLLDSIPQQGNLIYVESDLIWEPETMLTLLGDLTVVDAVAPQSVTGSRFYDTWGYRTMEDKHFPGYVLPDGPLIEILSAGSCIAMRPEVYRDCRFTEDEGIVGFGKEIHKEGMKLFLDPSVKVVHP